MYKHNNTITNGAEKLIDGVGYIEMFLGDEDEWNFHDSEISSMQWERESNTFSVSIELIGCDFSNLKEFNHIDSVLLDFNFEGCIEVDMQSVDFWNHQYLSEIVISKSRKYLQCYFNGYPIRITSERLRVGKPRIIKKHE